MLSTSSTEDGTAIAVEPELIRNIAIIAHVGKYLERVHRYSFGFPNHSEGGALSVVPLVWCILYVHIGT